MTDFSIYAQYISKQNKQNCTKKLAEFSDDKNLSYEFLEKLFLKNKNKIINLDDATISAFIFNDIEIFTKSIRYHLMLNGNRIIDDFLYDNNLKVLYLLDLFKFYNSSETLYKNIKTFSLFQTREKKYTYSLLNFNLKNIGHSADHFLKVTNDKESVRNEFFRILNFAQWLNKNKTIFKTQNINVRPWLFFNYSRNNFFNSPSL
jgi:hypothetical protein